MEKSSLPHFLSLHFSPTRLFTTAVEKSSIDSNSHNGSGKVESTSLSHFTSLRLDFLQRQWKSRVYRTLPHFLTSLLSDSTFHNGSGKVEYRLDFSQRQWKSRDYLTFSLHFSPTRLFTIAVEKSSLPHFLTSLLSDSTFYNDSGKVESTALYRTFSLQFTPTRLFTTAGSGKVEPTSLSHFTSLRLDFLQRQWKSRVYLTLTHFLTSLLSDSTFYNSSGKVEYRLDFSQRQWKSRVYLTFSLHFSPTRLFTTAVEKSSIDSNSHNGSGKVESTSLSHFTSLRLDFLQWQWKSRVYLTFSLHFSPTRLFTTAVEKSSIDSTFHNGSGKVESTSLSHFTSLRLDFSQQQWKSRV